jgi:hypothetical protein
MTKPVIVLDEWIPVETPQGKGYAFLIETENHDNWYTIILDSRAIVTLPQEKILAQRSYSHGRSMSDDDIKKIILRFTESLHANARGPSEGQGQSSPRIVKE